MCRQWHGIAQWPADDVIPAEERRTPVRRTESRKPVTTKLVDIGRPLNGSAGAGKRATRPPVAAVARWLHQRARWVLVPGSRAAENSAALGRDDTGHGLMRAQHETQRVVCKFSARRAAQPVLRRAALLHLARTLVPSQYLGMLRCWAASQVACNIAFRIAAAPTSWRWPGLLCSLLPHRPRLQPAPGRQHLTRHPVPHFRHALERERSNAPVSLPRPQRQLTIS